MPLQSLHSFHQTRNPAQTQIHMVSLQCKNSMKRVRASMDRPSRTERRLVSEIKELLSVQIPIELSRIAVCHPIAMLGSASSCGDADGAAFREVFDIIPFLQQIMKLQSNSDIVLGMVLRFAAPLAIRPFSTTPSSPYWMNVIGGYEFPPTTAMSLTNAFSPWDPEGTTCVYSVADAVVDHANAECVFIPAHMVPSNVLPLYLIKYTTRE